MNNQVITAILAITRLSFSPITEGTKKSRKKYFSADQFNRSKQQSEPEISDTHSVEGKNICMSVDRKVKYCAI